MSHIYLFLIPAIRFSHRDTQQSVNYECELRISQNITNMYSCRPLIENHTISQLSTNRMLFILGRYGQLFCVKDA